MQKHDTHTVDKDLAICGLVDEIRRLEALSFNFDEVDRLTIRDCQIRLNSLMFDRLSNPHLMGGLPV